MISGPPFTKYRTKKQFLLRTGSIGQELTFQTQSVQWQSGMSGQLLRVLVEFAKSVVYTANFSPACKRLFQWG